MGDERQSIDDAGIRVIVVGVSSGFNAGKVSCLVRDNSDIKTVAKFDPKLFYLMESQLRSVVCPVVYEEGMFAYIGGMLTSFGDNEYVSYYVMMAVIVAAGLLYFYREKCVEMEKENINHYWNKNQLMVLQFNYF